MKNQPVADIEKIIQNYILGTAGEEDAKLLLDWLNKNPENRKILFGGKDVWSAARIGTPLLNEIEFEQWVKLQNTIIGKNHKSGRFWEWLKIAAIIVVALGAGWMGHTIYAEVRFSPFTDLKTVEVSKGQIREIFLADGTHVWLNADSKLSFPSDFNANDREVELQGEAFFEVTASEDHPFLVKTKNHTVKVKGTRFNICEYPESKIIETTLEEGKVKIISGNLIRDLFPGQQASFNTETVKVRISEADFEIYSSWKEGRFEFRNEPVGKVFRIMERWWDVSIDYPKDIENERISGVLRRYKPLEQHFQVIGQLIPIRVEINGDVIHIK